MRYILILLCIQFGLQVNAQFSLRNYSVKEGLPQSQVQIMLEDTNGYLWIGTYGGGLARYDGRNFKVYTTLDGLLSNIITYLKLDDEHNLWIVHPRGITKFDGVTFKKFVQPGANNNIRRIRRLYELNDTIFFSSSPGLLGKIYRDSVYYWAKPIRPNVTLAYTHLLPDKGMLSYLSDSTFLVEYPDNRILVSHKNVFNRLTSIFNQEDQVWMKTDKGYFQFDPVKGTFQQQSHWVKNHVINFDETHQVFWTRAENYFLKEYLDNGIVMTDTVFRDIDVNQVFHDSEGNTWFATSGTGLFKYFIQDFDKCSSDNLKSVMAIHKDRSGASWIGTAAKGLWRMKNGKITSYFHKNATYRNSINCIDEGPDGTIWVGTNYGLGKYIEKKDEFQWFTRENGLSHISVVNIEFDKEGKLWVGTLGGGLNYFEGDSIIQFTIQNGLRSNTISSSYFSDKSNTLYYGDEFGVCSIDSKRTITCLPIKEIENTSILSIQAYEQLLLIGSAGAGVVLYDPQSGFKRIISSKDGLPSDFIYFASVEDGFIWIGTEKGITRIRLNKLLDVVENLHFDYDNGLTGVETNQNAYYLSKSDKYFGLVDGLYEYNDMAKVKVRKSFGVHLTAIEIFYGEHQADMYADSLTGFYKIPVNPVLPFSKNHITFVFNRVDKRYPKSIKFKYFLKNFDKTWSQPSATNYATFSNLPPGEYEFQIMASDNKGSWSTDVLVYPFVIKAPFYRTTAFMVGMIILVIGIILFVYYLQVKSKIDRTLLLERIRAQEQDTLRKEIARDFHDEMGNQLTRIINYVSLLKMDGNGSSKVDLYSKVENSAKYLYNGTRDFIWAIDPVNDELSKLFIHIRDFGEKLFEEKEINFRAFNEIKRKVRLPYGFSREANLIFKEVMTNSFKHSLAKNVKLVLAEEQGQFVMTFEDDGIGFDYSEVEFSNGLKNIRERAERASAILRLSTAKNSGTRISLYFTLKKTIKYGLTF
jgi:ligand-binding sensor domain-containing protein/signal transduction histidine kinase